MSKKETKITIRTDEKFKSKITNYADNLGLSVSSLIRLVMNNKMREDENR
ncbi:type II toxin-antitoxin system RelB/DinJ family antitoxin [Zunongwangia atlantica]|nr:type II toxin-antitoxin system RelB/DinJ family antitoxin [Zunongwangia atlantica]